MAPPKKPWRPAEFLAEHIIKLVAELRYYLGGENYTSGRYAGTHTMLFVLEQQLLRALDLDGAGVPGDEISLPVSEVIFELFRAMEQLEGLLEFMRAAAKEAGARGGNGGCAAAAQQAVRWWLAADDDRMLGLRFLVGNLASLCQRGKPILDADAVRRREAELLEYVNRELVVPQESVERAGAGDALAKYRVARKGRLRIRRLLHR